MTAQVGDLVPAVRLAAQLGVVAGDEEVVKHQVIVWGAADPRGPAGIGITVVGL
jgi:hypothetical protein